MQHLLSKANVAMAAITGAQTDRMARDDGWRMLSIGRLVERLQFLAASLLAGLTQSTLGFSPAVQASASHQAGYSAMLSLLGSSSTFHATHHGRHDMAALIEFLVLDRDNPRSLGWVAKTLRGRLAKLEGDAPQEQCALSRLVPDAKTWLLHALLECDPQWQPQALLALLQACTTAASQVAQAIGTQYFTHAQVREKSVGA